MQLHHRYKVFYRQGRTAKYRIIGTFLGIDALGRYCFDLRPRAGTVSLGEGQILATCPTSQDHSLAKKVLDTEVPTR